MNTILDRLHKLNKSIKNQIKVNKIQLVCRMKKRKSSLRNNQEDQYQLTTGVLMKIHGITSL